MDQNMQAYYDYTVSPLGRVFYNTVWRQLEHIKDKKILDFGSGFGFTSTFLAKHNDVTAIELDQTMLDAVKKPEAFKQIHGDLSIVKAMPKASFDLIICHLVFEFVENPQEILQELMRVLKHDGLLSIVRHNRAGRIIQAVVQDCDLAEAHKLLDGAYAYSSAFGNIKYYEDKDLLNWSQQNLTVESFYGVRALASLHSSAMQSQENWSENMLALEWELLKNPHFIDIAYFKHLFLRKVSI